MSGLAAIDFLHGGDLGERPHDIFFVTVLVRVATLATERFGSLHRRGFVHGANKHPGVFAQ
ncbi:MAG: hypothetical protein QM817_38530 [Archangium sp.]